MKVKNIGSGKVKIYLEKSDMSKIEPVMRYFNDRNRVIPRFHNLEVMSYDTFLDKISTLQRYCALRRSYLIDEGRYESPIKLFDIRFVGVQPYIVRNASEYEPDHNTYDEIDDIIADTEYEMNE